MNVKIPDSWIRDYIETNATPKDIARALSLHAFSVEKIIPWDDGDSIYEVEVTPNRGDVLSVFGLSRELAVILPLMGYSCSKKPQPSYNIQPGNTYSLNVVLANPDLVPRFSAIVLDNAVPTQSSSLIRSRLEKVGLRAIDNIVDTTNYIMIDKGQPMHSFDYDKIKDNKMVVRESKQGEQIVTLDGTSRTLPDGVIVIEDGSGRLVDLCGIMGAKNSEVDENTKRVLLFVQVYDPLRIRRASMSLGHRTDAALRFEKGIDHDGVIPSLTQAVEMINQSSHSIVASDLIDIVNKVYPIKKVKIDYDRINLISGTVISPNQIDELLTKLGFVVENKEVTVPSWRYNDIEIPEDLAEEVIRLYGYYNIKGIIPDGQIPDKTSESIFKQEDIIKDYLKYQGFFECYTKSISNIKTDGENAIKIVNPLTEDYCTLRTSLTPQLLDVLKRNQNYAESIMLFEIASVYLPSLGDLPLQPVHLALVTKNVEYLRLKGVLESLFDEVGLDNQQPNIVIHPNNILSYEFDVEDALLRSNRTKTYIPVSHFNSVKEDLTLVISPKDNYSEITNIISATSKKVFKVEYRSLYENNLTLSLEFLDSQKQITSKETKLIKDEILANLSKINVVIKMS
ncbi:MAG: phenylalanine--tRNA ligase subunit beta [Microgenomates group bacterium]